MNNTKKNYKWVCSKCGMIIESQYKAQFLNNARAHLFKHFNIFSDEFKEEYQKIKKIAGD